nr:MAG TPA: hypothetical protein [Caudoviricetes sp.]
MYHYFKDRHTQGYYLCPVRCRGCFSLSTLQRYNNFRPKTSILTCITLL